MKKLTDGRGKLPRKQPYQKGSTIREVQEAARSLPALSDSYSDAQHRCIDSTGNYSTAPWQDLGEEKGYETAESFPLLTERQQLMTAALQQVVKYKDII